MKPYLILILTLAFSASQAQKFFTNEASISFSSKTALEDIEAQNKKGFGVLDVSNNKLEFAVLLKGFEFRKALMQEHFNENYVESDKYPKATFKGTVSNDVQWTKDGIYKTTIPGTLTLHGVTHPETATALITVKGGVISGTAEMQVKPADYAIKIPSLVVEKISETIKVAISVPSFAALNR